jgi:hypothetical protein
VQKLSRLQPFRVWFIAANISKRQQNKLQVAFTPPGYLPLPTEDAII